MPRLAPLLAELTGVRTAFVERLDAAPPEARARKPAPDVWSPLQVAEHTYRAEAGMLGGLERQIARGEDRKRLGSPSRLNLFALVAALRSPFKFSAPEVGALTLEGIAWDTLRADWLECETRWPIVIEAIPSSLLQEGLVRHPYAGPLTVEGTLRFLIAHGRRHLHQVHERLR